MFLGAIWYRKVSYEQAGSYADDDNIVPVTILQMSICLVQN